MSYTIQTNSKVLYLPKGSADQKNNERWEDDLFWFVKVGDNNVSLFTPRWSFQKSGWKYIVVAEVCKHAGVCEGGSIKFGTSPNMAQDLSPEEYIANYREKESQRELLTVLSLKRVKYGEIGFCNFKAERFDDPETFLAGKQTNSYRVEKAMEAVNILKAEYVQEKGYFSASDKTLTFRKKVETVNDFLNWINLTSDLEPFGVWTIHE